MSMIDAVTTADLTAADLACDIDTILPEGTSFSF
jgi:hypothetical protein